MVITAEAGTERPRHNGVPFPGTTDPVTTAITRRTTNTVAAGPSSSAATARSVRGARADQPGGPTSAASRSAERFLWAWVMLSMVISAAANATDSWLTAPEHLRLLATVRAFGPPIFIMVTTHIAGLLIKMRHFGWPFVLSLLIDAVVSVFSFILSYSAISHLMLMLGTPPEHCGLWPLAIDLMGVNAAVALFALSYRRSRHTSDADHVVDGETSTSTAALTIDQNLKPVSASERRQWWDEVAATVQDRHQYVRAISERSPREVADVLRLTHDDAVSQRAIADVVGLNSRIVRAIQRAGDEVLHIDSDAQE